MTNARGILAPFYLIEVHYTCKAACLTRKNAKNPLLLKSLRKNLREILMLSEHRKGERVPINIYFCIWGNTAAI